jgi:hypothetical protein
MTYPESLNTAEDLIINQLEKDFLESVKITIKKTDWDKLERDLQVWRDGGEIVDGLPWAEYNPHARLEKLFEVALEVHGEYMSSALGIRFDLKDPNAIKWIQEFAASEIKYISDSEREAIREIILDGYQRGTTPQQQARAIRQHIGLDPRRSKTLLNYGENLFSKGKVESEVWRLVQKKGQSLLAARANVIAVNEATEAGGRAVYESTKGAYERGVLPAGKYEAYRMITADEQTCETCNSHEGEPRLLPDGTYPSTGSLIPKMHVSCRCVEGIREMGMKKQSTKKRASGVGIAEIVFDCQAVKRKDGVLYVPTVPMVEGVYEQWGFRVLRSYQEFEQYSHWLNGVPVVVNHEDVSPEARRVGQLFDVSNSQEDRKVTATTRFYELDLTQRELEAILSGEPHDGSLRWECYLIDEGGTWTDPRTGEAKQYDLKEVGPYVFYEYSFVKSGVITTQDGAGFNMQCKDCKDHDHQSSAPGGADSMEIEQIKEMIQEAVKPLMEKNAALEQEITTLKGEQTKVRESIEADRKTRVFESFQSKLKAGHLAKAGELYEAYQKDPAAWVMENADKFIQAKETSLKGSPMAGDGGQVWSLEQERAKLKADGKVI